MVERFATLLAALAVCSVPAGADTSDLVARIREHTEYLASDELEGRGNGSPGLEVAGRYVAQQFESLGLEPIAPGSYRQELRLPDGVGNVANVVGLVRAAAPTTGSVVVTAHYDGLGRGAADDRGDSVYNGALDNAIGVAALIELARRYAGRSDLPRHLVFVATAGEELGAFGARRYLADPAFPAEQIVMALNIDGFNVLGPMADVIIMPRSGVGFREQVASVAASMNLVDSTPEWVDGMDRSFDSAEFLARGVPAVTVWWGSRFVGPSPEESGAAQREIGRRHHRPSDEIASHWRWDGVGQHLELYARLVDFYLRVSERPRVLDPDRFRRDGETPSR